MSPGQSNASHHCPLLPAAAITQMGRWLLLLPLGPGQKPLLSSLHSRAPLISRKSKPISTHRKWLLESELLFLKPEWQQVPVKGTESIGVRGQDTWVPDLSYLWQMHCVTLGSPVPFSGPQFPPPNPRRAVVKYLKEMPYSSSWHQLGIEGFRADPTTFLVNLNLITIIILTTITSTYETLGCARHRYTPYQPQALLGMVILILISKIWRPGSTLNWTSNKRKTFIGHGWSDSRAWAHLEATLSSSPRTMVPWTFL